MAINENDDYQKPVKPPSTLPFDQMTVLLGQWKGSTVQVKFLEYAERKRVQFSARISLGIRKPVPTVIVLLETTSIITKAKPQINPEQTQQGANSHATVVSGGFTAGAVRPPRSNCGLMRRLPYLYCQPLSP